MISDEGAGKTSLIYLLAKFMGGKKVLDTNDPARDVWGNFNSLMMGAFLVIDTTKKPVGLHPVSSVNLDLSIFPMPAHESVRVVWKSDNHSVKESSLIILDISGREVLQKKFYCLPDCTIELDLKGTTIEITKHMLNEPRRIGSIDLSFRFAGHKKPTEKEIEILESIGNTCPVAKSIHPDVKIQTVFTW